MYNKPLSNFCDLHTSSLWSISGIIKIKIIVGFDAHFQMLFFHLFQRLHILVGNNDGIDIDIS